MADVFSGLVAQAFDFWAGPVLKNNDGTLYCPGFTGETYMKSPHDYMVIEGASKTPGLIEVHPTKGRDLDKKKAAGTNGARLTIHGIDAATVDLEITIWTPEQLRKLRDLWAQIFPQSNKRPPTTSPTEPWPPAFDVQHPWCDLHKIKALIFLRGEGPIPGRFPRSRMFKINAVEFLPPQKGNAKGTPVKSKGSKLDPSTTTHPTPGSSKTNTGPN